MTLSCCRLRCPAWAARYAGPAPRRMSATSSEARTASAGRGALPCALRCALWGREHAELVERADHGTHRARGHFGVERGGVEPAVAKQSLDNADIDAVFQQMRRETVPQRVRPDPLGDLRRLRGLGDDPVQMPGADRPHRVLAGEQPALRMHYALLPPGFPPVAQQRQQISREHGVAVAATLAPLDPEQHALAVDVRDLE